MKLQRTAPKQRPGALFSRVQVHHEQEDKRPDSKHWVWLRGAHTQCVASFSLAHAYRAAAACLAIGHQIQLVTILIEIIREEHTAGTEEQRKRPN